MALALCQNACNTEETGEKDISVVVVVVVVFFPQEI